VRTLRAFSALFSAQNIRQTEENSLFAFLAVTFARFLIEFLGYELHLYPKML